MATNYKDTSGLERLRAKVEKDKEKEEEKKTGLDKLRAKVQRENPDYQPTSKGGGAAGLLEQSQQRKSELSATGKRINDKALEIAEARRSAVQDEAEKVDATTEVSDTKSYNSINVADIWRSEALNGTRKFVSTVNSPEVDKWASATRSFQAATPNPNEKIYFHNTELKNAPAEETKTYTDYMSAMDDFKKAVNTEYPDYLSKAYGAYNNLTNRSVTITSEYSDEERKKRLAEIDKEIENASRILSGLSRATSNIGGGVTKAGEENRKKITELKAEKKKLERVGTFSAAELLAFEIEDAEEEVQRITDERNKHDYRTREGAEKYGELSKELGEAQKKVEELKDKKSFYDNLSKYSKDINDDNFGGQWSANYGLADISRTADKAMARYLDNSTDENFQIAAAYEVLLREYQHNNKYALDDTGESFPLVTKSAAGYMPQFIDQGVAEILGGGIGAALGYTVGLPTAGASIGAGLATGAESYEVMRGSVFRTLLAEGVDEETAREAANDEALISSIIEGGGTALSFVSLGGGKVIDLISDAAKKSVAKGSKNAAVKFLANYSVNKAAKKAASEVGTAAFERGLKIAGGVALNTGSEYLEEASQQGVSIANRERAISGNMDKNLWVESGKVIADAVTGKNPEAREEMHEAGLEGAKIGLMFGSATAITNNVISSYANAKTVKMQNEIADFIISDEETLNALIAEGKASGKGTYSEKIAIEIEKAKEKGSVTREQIKRLIASNEVYIENEARMSEAVEDNAEAEPTTLEEAAKAVVEERNKAERGVEETERGVESVSDASDTMPTPEAKMAEMGGKTTNRDVSETKLAENLDELTRANEKITVDEVKKATGFGDAGASMIVSLANTDGVTFTQAKNTVETAYLAGYSNLDSSQVSFETETQINAFTAGKTDRLADNTAAKENAKNATVYDNGVIKNEYYEQLSPAEQEMFSVIADDFGESAEIVNEIVADIVDGKKYTASGSHVDGKVTGSATTEKPVVQWIMHESGHRMEQLATDEWNILSDALYARAERLGRRAKTGISEGMLFDKVKSDYEAIGKSETTSGYVGEVVMRELETIFNSAEEFNAWRAELDANPRVKSAWEKFVEWFNDILERIKWSINNRKLSPEAKAKADIAELERIKGLLGDAYKATRNAVAERAAEVKAKQSENINSDNSNKDNIDNSSEMEYNGSEKNTQTDAGENSTNDSPQTEHIVNNDNEVKEEDVHVRAEETVSDTSDDSGRGTMGEETTGRKGQNRERISRKIKEILRKLGVERTHDGINGRGTARVEQKETAEAFKKRAIENGYTYSNSGNLAIAYKEAPKSKWNDNAKVATDILEDLGFSVIVFENDLRSNRKGVSQISTEGATFGIGDMLTVFISSELSLDGLEVAYHEAFHALRRSNNTKNVKSHYKMIDIISDGVNVESEMFEKFVSKIAKLYSYEVEKVSIEKLSTEVMEELYAWYIGTIKASSINQDAEMLEYIEQFSDVDNIKAQIDAVFAETNPKIQTLKHTKNIYSLFKGETIVAVGDDVVLSHEVATLLTDNAIDELRKVVDENKIEISSSASFAKLGVGDNDVIISGNPKVAEATVNGKKASFYVFKVGSEYYICEQKYLDAFNNGENIIKANKDKRKVWSVHDKNDNVVGAFMPATKATISDADYDKSQSVTDVLEANKARKSEQKNAPFNSTETKLLCGRPKLVTFGMNGSSFVTDGVLVLKTDETAIEYIKGEYKAKSDNEVTTSDNFGERVEKVLENDVIGEVSQTVADDETETDKNGRTKVKHRRTACIAGDMAFLFDTRFYDILKKRSSTMKILSGGSFANTVVVGYDSKGDFVGLVMSIRPIDGAYVEVDGKQIPYTRDFKKGSSSESATKEKATTKEAPKKSTPKVVETTTKIDDFGEKIGGARKDQWSSRGLLVDDLDGMNDRERDKNVKKDNVWKRPNYRALVEAGGDRGLLWATNEIRKSLNQNVYYGYNATAEIKAEKQKLFIETARAIQAMAENAKTKADFEAMGEKWLLDNGYLSDTGRTYGRYAYTPKFSQNPALAGGNYLSTIKYLAANFDNLTRLADRNQFAVDAKSVVPKGFSIIGGEDSVGSKLVNGEWVKDTSYGVAKGRMIIKNGFATREEALEWLKQGIAKKKGKTRFVPQQLLEVHRKGANYRDGKSVDGQRYIDTFGFKGGEFGNWMSAKDRQVSLDYGYDALKDLADALGIDDTDISFGGNLNIAFGARGQGLSGAAAHYENERRVINLTKMNGAGSLAHEWFHALDDFMGGYTSEYATNTQRKLPERSQKAVRDLITAMRYKDATQEETDLARQHAYDRAIKSVTYQVKTQFGWVEKFENGTLTEGDTKYFKRKPTQDDVNKYHELLTSLLETGDAKYIDELSNLRKEVRGNVIPKEDRDSLSFRIYALKPSAKEGVQLSRKSTDFYNNSVKFGQLHSKDGDYWESTVEMAARAFACYVADKTNKQNDYLTAHSDSAITLDMDRDGNPVVVRAFPVGEERTAINNAFDNLVEALKADGFLHEREQTEKPAEISYSLDEVLDGSKNYQYSLDSLKEAPSKRTDSFLDAVEDLQSGKKGAADRLAKYAEEGMISTEEYKKLVERYGAIPVGENPSRDVSVPKKTEKDKKVSQTVRTILEAKVTPDAAVPTIEKMVEDGVFSYEVYSDEQSMNDAKAYIEEYGWDESLEDWFHDVEKGIVSKQHTVTGWALYNNAANIAATTTSESEKKTATHTALKILDAMVKHQRSAAQALQATRVLKKLSPETQLYCIQKSVSAFQKELTDKYGKKAPDLKIDEELAEKFIEAESAEERLEIEKEIYKDIGRQMPSRFADKWNAWRYLAMLGNLRTHGRNILGNAGFAPIVALKDLTATGIEAVVHRVSGKRTLRGKSLVWGSKADRALLKAAWGDYATVADLITDGGKYNDSAVANKHIEEGRRIFKFKPLEWARKANSKALEVEDMWFAQPHYAYALAQYCKANNITPEQIARGNAIQPARDYAIKEAQKATYRDTNAFSQFVSDIGRKDTKKNAVTKAGSVVIEGVLPFRKTPANILVRGIEYSPIGLLKGISYDLVQVGKGNMKSYEAIDNISAGLTGTGLLGLGIWLASQGLIRGFGEDDEDEKAFKELTGHQGYALELPDGTSITLDWLAPEALPFFVGVNLWEATQDNGKDMSLANILQSVSNISEPMLEMSCLQGLNDLIENVGYASSNNTSGLVSVIASATASYLTQGIPTLLGQAERTGEEHRMTTYTEKNNFFTGDMQYIFGKASAKIPFLDYNQIPYIDAWGRKEASGTALKRGLNNFLNPAYTSTIEESDMEKELLRLYEATGEGSVFPDRAAKYFTVDGKRKDLTADEYVRYATLKGEKSYKLVSDLVKSEAYKKLDDGEKLKAIEEAYDYANQKAKEAISNYETDSWVKTTDDFGSGAGSYLSFRASVSDTRAENGGEITKPEVADIILGIAENDSEAWDMYLSMYDDKGAIKAYEDGVQIDVYANYVKGIAKAESDDKLEKAEVVDVISGMDINNDDAWTLYLSKYDSKAAVEAEKHGIDAKLFMSAVVDMSEIRPNYDKNGKAVSGSRRTKVERYLNSVCGSYKEYLFLLGTEFESVKKDPDYISYFGR